MRKLNAARIQQEEAVECASWKSIRIQPRLHLLAEDLSLLVATIDQTIVVLHFGFFLADLDHVVEIGDL